MKLLSSISTLLCGCLIAYAQESPKAPALSPTPVPQQLRILPQPDAPVRIVSANIKWATPSDRFAVEVYPVVENISQRGVATYTTRWEENPQTGRIRCLGSYLPAKGLLPGEKKGNSTWQGNAYFDPAPRIWIDFVEFKDGSRWGADECKTGELIDGGRAGARAQRDQLLEIYRQKGADALMSFIRENYQKRITEEEWKIGVRPVLPIQPPAGHSRRWEDGFTNGAREIIERVIKAEHAWGPDEIEHELSRPIGPSEKKSP